MRSPSAVELTPAVQDLIQHIYLAGADASRWPEFLDAIRAHVDAPNAGLSFVDKSDPSTYVSAAVGIAPELIDEYNREYTRIDPFTQAARSLDVRPGFIGLVQDLISDEELVQTEYYQRFGARSGIIGGLVCFVFADGPLVALIALNRHPGKFFGDYERALFQTLFPHLRTAMQIHRELLRKQQLGRAALATLNRLRSAVFICDDTSRVLHANASARTLRRYVTSDKLVGPREGDHALLRRAVAAAGSATPPGAPLLIPIDGDDGAQVVAVVRAVEQDPVLDMCLPLVAVIIPSPEELTTPESVGQVGSLFGLTRAEARVALSLCAGGTLRDVAQRLSMSYETARSHVKHAYDKTGTATQAQLVSRLLTSLVLT